MITLRGLTWEHPRAIDPIHAASAAYSERNPSVVLEWTSRPLREFESSPLEELTSQYDILSIDHPFVGDGAATGSLTALGAVIDRATLAKRADAYAGRSYESYEWNGELWALPVDAACMVGAARAELASSRDLPERWEQVVPFLRDLGRERGVIAANPTHLYGTYLSMCEALHTGDDPADHSRGPRWWGESGIHATAANDALDLLREVVDACAPRSLALDPVQVLDEIAGAGEALYTPLVFGYSTYALRRAGHSLVTFRNAPTAGHRPTGTLSGGVGLGISGRSEHQREAAEFLLFATSDEVQRGAYALAGGQPASTAAWQDDRVNESFHGFFRDTWSTMTHSFVRPRRAGYPRYQREAAQVLHEMFRSGDTSQAISSALNRMWRDVESG